MSSVYMLLSVISNNRRFFLKIKYLVMLLMIPLTACYINCWIFSLFI